jgi:thiosulfate/3-mercaptopyruvate sulfurtransferase
VIVCPVPLSSTSRKPAVHPLISTAELSARLGEEKLRIFDCTTFLHPLPEAGQFRVETGQKAYNEVGHIPGAALIELQEDLSDPTSGLRFTALAPAALVRAFKAKGVGNGNDVVLYAGGDQWWATRVWWLLRTIGFDSAAVLDGGLKKWRAEGRPLSTAATAYPAAASLTLNERRGLLTGKDGVLQALESDRAAVVDCLREELHKGTAPYHYGRPGHITGSVSVPAAALFAPDGSFKPVAELRALFAARGIEAGSDRQVVTYCGGGIAATGDAFALTALLGHEHVTVYDNSLQEWAADSRLPMSVG